MRLFKIYISILFFLLTYSCNENNWLKEEAYDFYSAENSFQNEDQFNAAIARLYEKIEPYYSYWPPYVGNAFFYTSDIAYDAIAITHQLNSYDDKLIPEAEMVTILWDRFYSNIFDANVILDRIDNENIIFNSEENKNKIKAEAHFFRAFYYRFLGILYGGVPLVTEEIKEPKRNFVRASEQEIWDRVVEDLEYARSNLPSVSEISQDGKLTKAAASHLLAEIYNIRREYDKAIQAATEVIDNPNYALMTDRFGTRANEEGDVYWDLFRRGNQNRNGGINTEGIWVKQYEYQKEGSTDYRLTWVLIPNYKLLKDDEGNSLFIGPSNQYGGDGAGWMVASDYMLYDIWENDPGDMRNSDYNITRDIKANNPDSKYYGQYIVESGAINSFPNALSRWWSAIIAKAAPINNFPEDLILDEKTGLVSGEAAFTFRDHYIMRLAETYLLRAEAYLGKGDLIKAASDINVVRQRARASMITPDQVDIDFILDERARELNFEFPRLLTLMRLNKLVEKVAERDPMHNGKYANHGISAKHSKWPIPQSEIERNTGAVLEQNPGY